MSGSLIVGRAWSWPPRMLGLSVGCIEGIVVLSLGSLFMIFEVDFLTHRQVVKDGRMIRVPSDRFPNPKRKSAQ